MKISSVARLCLIVFALGAVSATIFSVIHDAKRSAIFHQVDYEEGNILNTAVRINQGLSPYPDPHSWPVVINPYGPLPYYLTAIPVRLFGPRFAPARDLIVGMAVLCAVFIGLLVHRFTGSALLGTGFGGLFLWHRLVDAWVPVLRVDFVALVLVLLGVYVFARWPNRWPVTALLLSLAIFTKFSFLAAPAACFTFLLVGRQWKRAIQFAVTMSGLLALFFGTAILATHGGFAYDVFRTEGSPMVWANLPTFYHIIYDSNPLLMIFGVGALIYGIVRRQFEFPVLYGIFSLLASATAAKLGSNMNHLFEFVAVLCILSGWIVGKALQGGHVLQVGAAGCCVLMAAWSLTILPHLPPARPVPACAPVYQWVGDQPSDRILSENIGLLVVNRKTVWVSNPFAYKLLAESGKAPDEPLQHRIRGHWFDYVVLADDPHVPSTRWSPAVLRAIIDSYVPIGTTSCRDAFYIYGRPATGTKKP